MWIQRLVRFFVIILAAVMIVFLARTLVERDGSYKSSNLFQLSPKKFSTESLLESARQTVLGSKNEPIVQPAGNIQQQSQSLIESIKKLPEDQVEAVKKQLFKEFCQDYCQSASEGAKND